MSEHAREVVRYIKAVERGPDYQIIRPPNPPFYEFPGAPRNRDWMRAHLMDLCDPLENAMAALRIRERQSWQTFMADTRRYLK